MIEQLQQHGIKVATVMPAVPGSTAEWQRRTWVICEAPWDQYNRSVMPGTYMDAFDGDVEAFVARYRMRYPEC